MAHELQLYFRILGFVIGPQWLESEAMSIQDLSFS